MRYIVTLVLGMLVGVGLFLVGMVYNPFSTHRGLSPLSVSEYEVMSLSFSRVPAESIVFTNDGESQQKPHPQKVQQLWEAPIRLTSANATLMRDARGQTAGIGVKFASRSERTKLLSGQAIVDSVWYIYLPGRGSLFVEQSENYWPFLQDVVIPAYRSGSNSWKGTWLGDMTAGPGALGTAVITGGTGSMQGLSTIGVESLSADAYSAEDGPVSAEGRILIEIPTVTSNLDDE